MMMKCFVVLLYDTIEALTRVEYLTGKSISFVEGDVTNEQDLDKVFQRFSFFSVIHLAAIKAVGESTQIPLEYYHNNVTGSLNLLRVMERYKVKNLVFSSSATVYGGGEPDRMPVNETASLGPVTNPYGRTKLFVEEILQDLCASDPEWNVCLLRFFNPVGAHPSGLIGECPQGVPNNLLPYVIRVLQGHLPCVQIFGSDYDTTDGTGVRDYIHVCDLATGHVAALKKLEMEQAQKKKDQSLRASTPSSPIPPPAATVPVSPSSPLPTPKPSYSSSSVSSVSSTSLSGSESDSALSSSSSSSSTSSSIASPISPSFSDTLTPSSSSKAQHQRGQCMAYNLGTGAGYSVLEIINAMEKATQKTIPYKIVERRLGDVGVCTADATLANEELGWKPLYTMDDMCQDMWRWTRRNPNGYAGPLVDND
jgi:UDP-glucose 4-epimerase